MKPPKQLYLTDPILYARFQAEAPRHGIKSPTTYLRQCLRVLTDLAGDEMVYSYLMRLQAERGEDDDTRTNS